MAMGRTVRIENASWVAAWDQGRQSHVYLRDADVVFEDDRIAFVGRGWRGQADETIDGRDRFVMPGLIDIHAHPHHETAYKGIREEHGVPEMYMTGLYERSQAFKLDREGRAACAELSYADLLLSGVTSLADLSSDFGGWLDLIGRSGLRGFIAPSYASARWKLENNHVLGYAWDEAAGRQGFEDAIRLIDAAEQHPSGRLSGVVSPAQIDTCTEDLLRDSIAFARQTGRPCTTHLSQSVMEFNEMVRRHGVTPAQFAHRIGFLGPETTLGHCIFIDEHSRLSWHSRRDLAVLAETGTTVAHCPSPFARYGDTLEDVGRYRRAGVHMGVGTDVAPHNLIEEMRLALILSHVAAENIHTAHAGDLFHMATVEGARAMRRDDLGRLAPGAKADIVSVDLSLPEMMPARDPLKSLIYHAADRAVRDVWVDGKQVVAEGKVLTLDREDAAGRLAEAQARMCRDVPQHDYAGRSAEEIAPLSLPLG
jgi:cytosine/adenosine deaminase-related metal-dependent hydrolase